MQPPGVIVVTDGPPLCVRTANHDDLRGGRVPAPARSHADRQPDVMRMSVPSILAVPRHMTLPALFRQPRTPSDPAVGQAIVERRPCLTGGGCCASDTFGTASVRMRHDDGRNPEDPCPRMGVSYGPPDANSVEGDMNRAEVERAFTAHKTRSTALRGDGTPRRLTTSRRKVFLRLLSRSGPFEETRGYRCVACFLASPVTGAPAPESTARWESIDEEILWRVQSPSTASHQ